MSFGDFLFGTEAKQSGPWGPQSGHLENMYGHAQGLYNQAMAGNGANLWGQMGQQFGNMGNQLANSYNTASNWANNSNLEQDLSQRTDNLYNSDAFQNQMAATNNQITQGMNKNLASSAIGANALGAAGSSRSALMDANLISNAQNAMATNNANMYMNAQNQVNQNAQNQANMAGSLGNQGMNYLTQSLNYTPENFGWNQLGNYQGAIGNPIMPQMQPGQTGQLGNILMAGAKFSDENLKTNIVRAGAIGGIPFYNWDWNEKANGIGLKGRSFGVIAQEIEEIYPKAVSTNSENGFKEVDYSYISSKINERLK